MDLARARSPPASLGRRPIGPRSPGKPGSLPVKNIIPLDLTARLQEEVPGVPRTASPEPVNGLTNSVPGTPSSAPVLLRSNTSRSESSQAGGHGRTGSIKSQASQEDVARGRSVTRPPSTSARQETADAVERAPAGGTDAPTETEKGATAAPTRASVSPVPSARADPDISAGDEVVLDGLALEPGADDAVSATPPSSPPRSPPAASPELAVAPDMPAPLELPSQDFSAVSPTDTIAGEILDMYIPPPTPIVPPESEPETPAPRPPSIQTDGTWGINGVNGTHGAKGVNGVNGLHGVGGLNGLNGYGRPLSEKGVQASVPVPEPSTTPASTRASTPALLKIVPKRPPLAPTTALNLDPEPIKWKGMTLEAAQWTFTSEQLQETVSRAIRQSAAESFIHIVSTHTHDVELPEELERLESVRRER